MPCCGVRHRRFLGHGVRPFGSCYRGGKSEKEKDEEKEENKEFLVKALIEISNGGDAETALGQANITLNKNSWKDYSFFIII